MVTILPFEADDDLLREVIPIGVAVKLDEIVGELTRLTRELRGGGLVDRDEWDDVFARLAAMHAGTRSALEHAQSFLDQHEDETDEGDDDGGSDDEE